MRWLLCALAVPLTLSACSGASDVPDGADGEQDGDGMTEGDDGGPPPSDDAGSGGDDASTGGDDGGTILDQDPDGGDDLDGGGDSSSGNWAWCPDPSEYVGDNWGWTLRVSDAALYCGSFNEARTLKEEYVLKGRMRVIAGDYPVPSENGTWPFRLPVCFEMLEPGDEPVHDGVGTISSNHSEYNGGIQYRFTIVQPMRTGSGTPWDYRLELNEWIPADQTVIDVLDGAWPDPYATWVTNILCHDGQQCWRNDDYQYASCHFDTARHQWHKVDFEGGTVTYHFMMGDSMASTEPGAFVRAEGILDGVAFDQLDYYKLIYNPEHHHFTRDYAVLFDAPIAGACGLMATQMEAYEPTGNEELSTIDCALNAIDKKTITSIEFENGW
jgi:hypothetical protein